MDGVHLRCRWFKVSTPCSLVRVHHDSTTTFKRVGFTTIPKRVTSRIWSIPHISMPLGPKVGSLRQRQQVLKDIWRSCHPQRSCAWYSGCFAMIGLLKVRWKYGKLCKALSHFFISIHDPHQTDELAMGNAWFRSPRRHPWRHTMETSMLVCAGYPAIDTIGSCVLVDMSAYTFI